MPIRTLHGRAAVYRRVWGAPLRSVPRLLATLAVVAFVGVLIGVAVGSLPEDPERGAPGHLEPSGAAPGVPAGDPVAEAVMLTSRAFAERWVSHSPQTTDEQWAQRLHPYTLRSYWPVLETVDPANIPSSTITRPPRVVALSDTSATVDVATDGAILRLELTKTPSGWRVASYSQAG